MAPPCGLAESGLRLSGGSGGAALAVQLSRPLKSAKLDSEGRQRLHGIAKMHINHISVDNTCQKGRKGQES